MQINHHRHLMEPCRCPNQSHLWIFGPRQCQHSQSWQSKPWGFGCPSPQCTVSVWGCFLCFSDSSEYLSKDWMLLGMICGFNCLQLRQTSESFVQRCRPTRRIWPLLLLFLLLGYWEYSSISQYIFLCLVHSLLSITKTNGITKTRFIKINNWNCIVCLQNYLK